MYIIILILSSGMLPWSRALDTFYWMNGGNLTQSTTDMLQLIYSGPEN